MSVDSVCNKPNNTKQNLAQHMMIQAASATGGYGAGKLVGCVVDSVKFPLEYKLVKNGHEATEVENKKLLEAFDKMLTQSGLKLHKIKVHIFNKSSLEDPEIRKKCQKAIELDKQLQSRYKNKLLRDLIVSNKTKSTLYAFITGTNALHSSITNSIIFNENLVTAAPHEAGHAIIVKFKRLGTRIHNLKYQIVRNKIIRGTIIVGLLMPKYKEKEDKPLTLMQKTANTIHNNLGYIASALTLPILINEYQASHISEKYMKPLLPKNLYNKVRKNNRLGFASYAISTLATGIAAATAVKAKDKISEKIQSKLAERQAKHMQKS